MNEVQLIATYFRNFDLDRNGRIDGLELLKTIFRMNGERVAYRWILTLTYGVEGMYRLR